MLVSGVHAAHGRKKALPLLCMRMEATAGSLARLPCMGVRRKSWLPTRKSWLPTVKRNVTRIYAHPPSLSLSLPRARAPSLPPSLPPLSSLSLFLSMLADQATAHALYHTATVGRCAEPKPPRWRSMARRCWYAQHHRTFVLAPVYTRLVWTHKMMTDGIARSR